MVLEEYKHLAGIDSNSTLHQVTSDHSVVDLFSRNSMPPSVLFLTHDLWCHIALYLSTMVVNQAQDHIGLYCNSWHEQDLKEQTFHSNYQKQTSQSHHLSQDNVWVWELDAKKGWLKGNRCIWNVGLMEIVPNTVDSRGNEQRSAGSHKTREPEVGTDKEHADSTPSMRIPVWTS